MVGDGGPTVVTVINTNCVVGFEELVVEKEVAADVTAGVVVSVSVEGIAVVKLNAVNVALSCSIVVGFMEDVLRVANAGCSVEQVSFLINKTTKSKIFW